MGPSRFCCVHLEGRDEPLDDGGGIFCFHRDAVQEDDDGTVLRPASNLGAGRWIREIRDILQVTWFGARCDGVADDRHAVAAAIESANRTGGTIAIPRGRTCRISQLDLGRASPKGKDAKAAGLTIKGGSYVSSLDAGAYGPSTLLVDPAEPTGPACAIMTDAPADEKSGGIVLGPNVQQVSFEDLQLKAGPHLANCVVNVSAEPGFGDPHSISFRRVQFSGNGTTAASVFLHRTSWLTFDHCLFSGSVYAIKEGFSTKASYSTNPVLVDNLFYRAVRGARNAGPLVELWDVAGAHIVGNKFENGPWGIYIGQLTGGSVTDNWFNGEGENAPSGEWLDIGCNGCVIGPNHIEGGHNGIRVRGGSGTVVGNYFIGQRGTPLLLGGNNIDVSGNYFHGGTPETATQTDVIVESGTGYRIGTNFYEQRNDLDPSKRRLTGHSVVLREGTTGTLLHNPATDFTEGGMVDESHHWAKTILPRAATGEPGAPPRK